MEIIKNKYWDSSLRRVSVITPVFNRRDVLSRAIMSVCGQTYKDFEYIIINDGSTFYIDDIVEEFLYKVDFPMLYIKKENGGVHTARNIGIKYCRGEMVVCLDSDDEFVPKSLEVLISAWDSIPAEKKYQYREVCARAMDQNGNAIGHEFPDGINNLSLEESRLAASKVKGEHIGFWRSDIMKDNPWPEPEGINFVVEGYLWDKLSLKYKSFYINDIVRIYHIDNTESYTRQKQYSLSFLNSQLFNISYLLNRKSQRQKVKFVIHLCVFNHILRRNKYKRYKFDLINRVCRILYVLFYLPCLLFSFYFEKKRIKKN